MQVGSAASPALITSPTDKRQYQPWVLANGLRCTFVHDPQARLMTASVAVAAGHFHDPEDAQGLAHFLEHMLFLGTEAYPAATDFQDFIAANGGHHNAWTGTEYSNYYMSVAHDSAPAALDRFSRLFYQPCFHLQWIEQELQAIEAEFRLKQQDELRRLYQVHKATVNPDHPFRKFSVGNLQSLKPQGYAELQQQLISFFARWYRPQRMTLVLAGAVPFKQLQQWAERYFAVIPATPAIPYQLDVPLYLPQQLGVMLQVKPLKDAKRLIMTFPLPGIDHDYAHKTTSFIAHMIGYEGKGSLFSYLHRQHYIHSLAAGGGISGSNFKDFNINIQLTAHGLSNYQEVVAQVFAYLRLLAAQGLQPWRYRERQISIENAFKYQEPARTEDLASQLAVNMHHYPTVDTIFGDYRMDGLHLPRAQQLLAEMVPERLRLVLIHRQVETDHVEPLYGTHYQLQPLAAAQREAWRQATLAAGIQLPAANPFIRPLPALQPLPPARESIPQLLVDRPELRLWHLQDADFRAPKAHIYLHLKLSQSMLSAGHYAFTRLWCELVLEQLNEQFYDAEMAGFHFNLYTQQTGITLHVAGYSHGVQQLVEQLLQAIPGLQFSPERWHNVRQKLVANWHAAANAKPMSLLFARLNSLLQPFSYPLNELAEAATDLHFSVFQQWQRGLFRCVQATLFMHGDIPAAAAEHFAQAVSDFVGQPCERMQLDLRLRQLANGCNQYALHLTGPQRDHASMLVLQHPECSTTAQAAVLILQQLIQPRIFTQLRTEQQLGYVVGSSYLPLQQQPHLLLYVQSHDYPQQLLADRLQQFVHHFSSQLPQVLQQELATVQHTLQQQLTEQDPNLRLRAQRLWTSLMQEDASFQRLTMLAEAVPQWSPVALVKFWQQWLSEPRQVFLHALPKAL